MGERIVAAALQYDGLVFSLAPPARHCHVLRSMQWAGVLKDVVEVSMLREQGFLTSLGRYVSREEAAVLARAAGQLEHRTQTGPAHVLYSEDLW